MPDNSVALDAIPSELRALDQWVVWRYEQTKDGRTTKVPRNARTGRRASTTDARTWSSFDAAVAAADKYDGIGIVLAKNDPYAGADLDGCLNAGGEIHDAALEIVNRLASYTEVTPSGRGLRVIVRGNVADFGRKETDAVPWSGFTPDKNAELALFSEARYFTLTGDCKITAPTIEERQDVLETIAAEFFQGDGKRGPVDFSDVLEEITLGRERPTEAIEHLCEVDKHFAKWWSLDPAGGDGSQRDYHLAYAARFCETPRATVASILEHARDDDAHGRHDNEQRFKTYLARTIANAERGVEQVRRYRVDQDKKGLLILPDLPEREDVAGQCAWLTAVFNLDPQRPVTEAQWQGVRGPDGCQGRLNLHPFSPVENSPPC